MRIATAFVWNHGAQHYLITNWHIVTGRNAATSQLETPAQPGYGRRTIQRSGGRIQQAAAQHRSAGLIYPNGGRGVDVVAILLRMDGGERGRLYLGRAAEASRAPLGGAV
jgi:hypothetical protein